MTEPPPYIDVANLPAPAEGIVVTMFITVRSVARSRDFYSRVLGGTVVLEENSHGGPALRRDLVACLSVSAHTASRLVHHDPMRPGPTAMP